MNKPRLHEITQLQDFFRATPEVSFSGIGEKDNNEKYKHISRLLKGFEYLIPIRNKNDNCVASPCRAEALSAA